jgi:hypothetical protein
MTKVASPEFSRAVTGRARHFGLLIGAVFRHLEPADGTVLSIAHVMPLVIEKYESEIRDLRRRRESRPVA